MLGTTLPPFDTHINRRLQHQTLKNSQIDMAIIMAATIF